MLATSFLQHISVGRMARRTDRDSTDDQFVEENQRHRDAEARALTVTAVLLPPPALLAAAAAAAQGDDELRSWQSPPPGPPEADPPPPEPTQKPTHHLLCPLPPALSAGYGGMAGPYPAIPVVAELVETEEQVCFADLEELAELPDAAAAVAFRSFTPGSSPGRGSGHNWAPCTAGGHTALQANPEAARLATSAPVQPCSFFTHGPSAQASHGVPMSFAQAAAHQQEIHLVASFLQHQDNSAGQTELASASYSSVMSQFTQQFVPDSMQYNHSPSSLMSVAQQPSVMMPEATQQFVLLQQHQFARPAPLPYNSSSASLMSVTQQPTPDAAYAPAHCATVISEAIPVLAVAQNLVPSSLKEIFATHVMCDYTPRVPKQFATSRWATLEDLVSKLQQHAPAEVTKLGNQNLRQMITEWYKNHPAFENLPFSAWGKRLKNNAPQASARSLTFKFCFEHTPGGLGR